MNTSILKQPGWEQNSRIRTFGESGPSVIVLHGGPGAIGGGYRIARGLGKDFRVLEPWQRRSGEIPLSVSQHVEDLNQLILSRYNSEKPTLVGGSWGAMLALAYAEKYADNIKAIVLVGCGSFDKISRAAISPIRKQKIIDYISTHPEHKSDLKLSFNEQVMKWHGMTDSYETIPDKFEVPTSEPFDEEGFEKSWQDMLTCQEKGMYPQLFQSIKLPVLMLHGEYDPHPGKMIRDTLVKYIPHLKYHEFPKCGHDPEMEKYAKTDFFEYLRSWLKSITNKVRL